MWARQRALDKWGSGGLIADARLELKKAKAMEADSSLATARVTDGRKTEEMVVRKVTAKRIHLSVRGEDHISKFGHNGNSVSSWDGRKIHPDDLATILGVQ